MARYNRNPNPAFDNNTAGWVAQYTKAALRRLDNYARPDGRTGCFVDARASGSNHPRIWTARSGAAAAAIEPGKSYVTSVYVYSGRAIQVGYDLDHCGSQGNINATRKSGNIQLSSGVWGRIVDTSTAESGDAFLSTYLRFYSPGDDTYIGVTCAMVEDGTTSPNYRDGNNPGWAWAGTRGNSQSWDLDPTAHAGVAYIEPGQPVAPGDLVTLTSEGSGNPEGGQVTNVWSMLDAGGTGLTNADIEGRDLAFASFTAPNRPGTITVQLTVTDDNGNTDTDDVSVTVASVGPEPGRMLLGG